MKHTNDLPPRTPYEHIDRNVEAVQDKQDQAPYNKTRDIRDIENTMIDDTLSLIQTLDGTRTHSDTLLNPEDHEQTPFDTAVFLDKSARPVSRLMRDLWDEVSEGEKPQSKFLNVDKYPWLAAMGFDPDRDNYEAISPDEISLDRIDPELLRKELSSIRALYLSPKDFARLDEHNLEAVWDMPTTLDGKHVAVIDEVKSSGNTLRIATMLLERAFPEAHIEGVWWSTPQLISWDGGESNDHKRQRVAKYVPAWYSADSTEGRGIDDIDEIVSQKSVSKAQRIGGSILGTAERDIHGNFASHNNLSATIRRDLGRLASRYINQELVRYRPEATLPDEEYDVRVEQYYKKPADDVYAQWRKEQGR